jgi:hypothetical protein
VIAHISPPGYGSLIAMVLLMVGLAAGAGVMWFSSDRRPGVRRTGMIGLGVLAVGCLGFATAMPFILRPGPSFVRPSATARLEIESPHAGAVITGDPASVDVTLRLIGGTIVPATTTNLVPNQGHIHVYLDDRLLVMTGLEATIIASPGSHTLRAEFVASDHGPFEPPVTASVTFTVTP